MIETTKLCHKCCVLITILKFKIIYSLNENYNTNFIGIWLYLFNESWYDDWKRSDNADNRLISMQ